MSPQVQGKEARNTGFELWCDGCGEQPAVEPCNVCGGDFCQDCLDSHDCAAQVE